MLGKLSENTDLKSKKIAVLFNLEFVETLIYDFGVSIEQITFFADNPTELVSAAGLYGLDEDVNLFLIDTVAAKRHKRLHLGSGGIEMKFDVVVMNPPYQGPVQEKADSKASGSRSVIWDQFVHFALASLQPNGYLLAVHPPKWRKPEDKLFAIMKRMDLRFLRILSKKDGANIFKQGGAVDWYLLQNKPYGGSTTVIDSTGKRQDINLDTFPFLPNSDFELAGKIIAQPGDEKCDILYSYTEYETRKPWMSMKKSAKFCHPCVYTTGKKEIRYAYSSQKGKYFGEPKVIFGDGNIIGNAVVDFDGEYGITQHSMAIPIKSKAEGEELKKVLESKEFNHLLEHVFRFSHFQIDWRLFRNLKADFWKEFI
jgi:hypothetical protein